WRWLLLRADGDWRRHLWRAVDDAVCHADPPGGGDRVRLWCLDRSARCDWLSAAECQRCAPLYAWRRQWPGLSGGDWHHFADHALGGEAGPCDEPQAAETRLCRFPDAGGAEYAAQGAVLRR